MKKLSTIILSVFFVALNGFAQSGAGAGAISGTVQDASGSAVPGAMVEVTNEARGIRRAIETTSQGQFTAPALVPADGYKVVVSKSGFANYEATNITVQVGQNVDLHIPMSVASTATTVDVLATGTAVESTKTDVSQVIGQAQILDLPINGRRADSFALLTPAVAMDGQFGLLSFRGVAGHNNFMTDGNDTTNGFFNENAGRTRISSPISQEAVQEFQVISNNFAAEYGNAMGGVINTVTKSGSNDVHGTAYWFFRNRSLNARDRYASFNSQDIRHQSGGSISGPIKKDKIFYFFNYEATRRNFPAINSLTSNMFTTAGVLNLSSNPCPNTTLPLGQQATPAQCEAAIKMLNTRNFATVSRTVTQDLGFGKIDYRVSDKDSISVGLSMLRWVSPHGIQSTGIVFNTGAAIGGNADSTVRNAYGRVQWTRIVSPTILNEARFGWFKDRLFDDASPDFLYPGLGRADLTVNGTTNLGVAPQYPRLNPSENRFQFIDNLSWTKGAHTMKFGFDIATTRDFQTQLTDQYGNYNYSSLNSFAMDFSGNTINGKNWNTYSQRFGNASVDTRMNYYGFYGQDQYRINSRLLINYGLRYEYSSLPQPSITNPDYSQTAVIPTTKDNIAPRIGLTYNLTNDQKTILRIGYGIFYARYQTGLINTFFLSNNVYQKRVTYNAGTADQLAAGPVYPNFLPATTLNPPAGTVDLTIPDRSLRNPYTHQGNIGIERQINSTLNVTVSYLWSQGVRLYGVRDLNVGPTGAPLTYAILNRDGTVKGTYTTPTYRTPRPDSRYRRVNQVENPNLSYYSALAIQVNKRYSRGFQASASYTWSHAIDMNQSGGDNNIFFSSGPTSFENGNFAAEKGSSVNDARHRAAISFIYSPTFTRSNSWAARYLINNWQLSQVTTLQSSQPTNSTVTVGGNAFSGALVSGSLNGLGGAFGRVPFEPISNLNLDKVYRVDARLAKKLPVNERVTAYLQFEAFNVFNTPYDTVRRAAEYIFSTAASASSSYACSAATPCLTADPNYGTGSSTRLSPDGTNARRAQVSLRVTF
ncbi:MAG: carboxypeptidase regulatory-like domain-containing protein [Bryobacteraceae bacterium]